MTATAQPPTRVQELSNFVGGEHVAATSGEVSDVTDPSTGEVYAQAPVSGPADVDAALKAAATAQVGWRDATPAERSLALLRLADAIESRAEEIVAAECRNTGKPVALTLADYVKFAKVTPIDVENELSLLNAFDFVNGTKREEEMKKEGIHFFGMGVSGGEEGALKGPSMMPGGDPEAYKVMEPLFQANVPGEVGAPNPGPLDVQEHYGDAPMQDAADLRELRVAADANTLHVLARTTTMRTASGNGAENWRRVRTAYVPTGRPSSI